MNDRDLEILRRLPKEWASEDFTETVLRRAERMVTARREPAWAAWRGHRWAFLVGALALVLAVVLSSWGLRAHSRNEKRRAALAELEQIRKDQRVVARQIARLGKSPEPTIVYLGGDQDHDFVVDVSRLVEWAREAKKSTGPGQSQSPTNL